MMENNLLKTIHARLRDAKEILITSHLKPDGDAVGSVLGFGLTLEAADKKVQMVLSDKVPDALRFIPKSDRILSQPVGKVDFVVVVDAAEISRIGDALNGYGMPDLNIDHHISNTHFAKVNFVLNEASATAEILAEYLPELGFEIPEAAAEALLVGMITDTIGFRIPSVQSKTLRLAAGLMDKGASLANLYKEALLQKSISAARYWGAGLSKLQIEKGLAWTTLSLSDRLQAGYPERDDADLINVLSGIRGACIAVVFIEQPAENVKISWRAQPGYDVSSIAAQFGGGGHLAAAGAEVKGNLVEVQQRVLHATRQLFQITTILGEES